MSHIVTIKTEVRDAAAVRAACKRLGLAEPTEGKTRLFSGEVSGLADSTLTLAAATSGLSGP